MAACSDLNYSLRNKIHFDIFAKGFSYHCLSSHKVLCLCFTWCCLKTLKKSVRIYFEIHLKGFLLTAIWQAKRESWPHPLSFCNILFFCLDGLVCGWTIHIETGTPASPVEGHGALAAGRKGPRGAPPCPALCGPSVGDNELSCQAASLPFECGEVMRQDDMRESRQRFQKPHPI